MTPETLPVGAIEKRRHHRGEVGVFDLRLLRPTSGNLMQNDVEKQAQPAD
jgi:hypothetical protein